MNKPLRPGEDVALFIDWENFKISLATGHRHPNVSALKEEVSNHGRVVVAKAYADWVTRSPELRGASQFINDPPDLYAAGIDPVYVPTRLPAAYPGSRTIRVKNSVDVKMTADCIECAHSYPNIRTFVLVSGDSDFIHVINALRTMGKRVLIIGVSWATSRRLADQVDELILYDQDVDAVAPAPEPTPEPAPEPAPTPAPAGNGRSEPHQLRPAQTPAPPAPPASPKVELPEIVKAIEEIVRDERKVGGTPLLTSIKQRLMRRYPDFDEKKIGFSGFKKLMSRVAQEGEIRLITAGLVDWAIMADEPEPEEPHTTSTRGRGRPGGRNQRPRQEQTPEETTPSDGPAEEIRPDTEEASAPAAQSEHEAPTAQSPAIEAETPEPPSDAAVPEPAPAPEPATVPEPAEQPSIDLDALLSETLPALDLPAGPGDGRNGQRVADLIIAADTLENREDVDYVAFNFLVGEVCKALDDGLKAEHEEITARWGRYSRNFVTRMFRGLGNGGLFAKGWHTVPPEDGGRPKRLRTFYLNREHPLVTGALQARWQPGAPPAESESIPEPEPPEEETPVMETAAPEPVAEADAETPTPIAKAAPEPETPVMEAPTDALPPIETETAEEPEPPEEESNAPTPAAEADAETPTPIAETAPEPPEAEAPPETATDEARDATIPALSPADN